MSEISLGNIESASMVFEVFKDVSGCGDRQLSPSENRLNFGENYNEKYATHSPWRLNCLILAKILEPGTFLCRL